MVTIILPTASRPLMLRRALESVAEQTACNKIERIFVSENGGNRDSEKICAQFPTLPITYVFRKPATPLEHAQILMRECLQSKLTAFLHDDDWWAPSHLTNAVEGIESHPNAGAYGSSHFVVSGESSVLKCNDNLFPWFGASYPRFQAVWELSRLNVLMAQLLGTMSHYSTLVARTDFLKKSSYVYDLNNPFDNDRMLLFALSTHGSFIYNPIPEAFIQDHGTQESYSFHMKTRTNHMCETTRWMMQTSGKSWELMAGSFARRMALCPAGGVNSLKFHASKEWCVPELTRHLNTSAAIAA